MLNNRFRLVTLGFLAVALVIFGQMVRIQTSASAHPIDQWASSYDYLTETVQSERGTIFDRNGHLLAGNREVYEVGVDLRFVTNPQSEAATLAAVLGTDYARILQQVSIPYVPGRSEYVVVDDFVDTDHIQQLKDLQQNLTPATGQTGANLDGVIWFPHLQRMYPEGKLGSSVLGFYNYFDRQNAHGYFGVEEYYNALLAGVKQEVKLPLDPYMIQNIPDIPPGASLILSIDRQVQAIAEKELDDGLQKYGGTGGTILIMNPRNGEVLAMASSPRMDPNSYWEYDQIFGKDQAFNKAVSGVYEPGSVFKVLTMAAALDTGTVTPDTPFVDTGTITVGGIAIHNWDWGAWGQQTMLGCMQHSLNVCLSWVATQLGPTKFYEYLGRFGIGHRTLVDLAGEENFPLSAPGDPSWYPVNLATNSFGQGLAVTPIQLASAIAAVANDGKMMAPHVLAGYVLDGKQFNTRPVVVGTPISAQTAKTLSDMLATSLEKESSVALVPGYKLAGKTGTAQIAINGQYSTSVTNASFVGWGPVDDPRFLVYIWIERPTASIWGSEVAAPIFHNVVQQLVTYLGLPPDSVRLQMQGGGS